MFSNASLIYGLMLITGDFLAILIAFVLAYISRVTYSGGKPFIEVPAMEYLQVFLLLIPFWLIIFGVLGLYRRQVTNSFLAETGRLLVGSFMGVLLVIGYEFVASGTVFPTRSIAFYGLLVSFLLLILFRLLMRSIKRQMFKVGFGVINVMLIGSTDATRKLATFLSDTKSSGYRIVAIIGSQKVIPRDFQGEHFSQLDEGLKNIGKLNVHSIIQTQFYEQSHRNKLILDATQEKHLSYKFIPTHEEFFTGNHTVDIFHGFPVVAVHHTRLLGWGKVAKRLMDFILSLVALVILIPVFLIISLAILIFDFGPVFFRHTRVSRYGRKIKVIKFRTMQQKYSGRRADVVFREMDREDLLQQIGNGDSQIHNDPRVSTVGRFLRRTSLDELPQLWNVLLGQMSLVGPRAIIPEELALYKEYANLLLGVKTGITGLAQVSGRSDLDYQERTRLNLYYVQNWTIWLDIKILLKTVVVVFKGADTK